MEYKNNISSNFIAFGNIFDYVATSTWTNNGYFVYVLTSNVKHNIFYVNENDID
tara:strand:+ start:96 stop:257 length:162 start_codon:yes stop_codon:yes gene_type:complete